MRRKYIVRSGAGGKAVGVWWKERHKQFWVGGHDGCREFGDALLHAAAKSIARGRARTDIAGEVSFSVEYAGHRWRCSIEAVTAKAFDDAIRVIREEMPDISVTPVRAFRRLTY